MAGSVQRDDAHAAASRRAVVLAGGLGTRLQPYTTVLPKPLMPVGDRPVLDIVVRQLHRHGFDRVTIATGHLAELIEAFFGDGSTHGIPVDYFREEHPLGTVGALALIDGLDEDFLVMNGDVLTDLDYAALLEAHRRAARPRPIAVKHRIVQIDLGVLQFDADDAPDRIIGLRREADARLPREHGRLLLRAAALRLIEPGERARLPRPRRRLIDGRRDRPRLAIGRVLARHRAPRRLRAGARGVRGDAPRTGAR